MSVAFEEPAFKKGRKTSRVSEMLFTKKRAVSRTNSATSRKSSFGFVAPSAENEKPARIDLLNYFPEMLPKGEAWLAKNLNIKMLKKTKTGAVSRWAKFKGTLTIGHGRIDIELSKPGKNDKRRWVHDVGMIEALSYKTPNSKDFTILFHNDDKYVNFICSDHKSAKEVLTAILVEARIMGNVFNRLLKKTITKSWKKALRLNAFDAMDGEKEVDLSESELQDLVMEEDKMWLAEHCLREEIDLWRLSRGKDHPDVIEAYERLARWLRQNVRHEESAYWFEQAENARKLRGYRMKHEMLPAEVSLELADTSALDALRNPNHSDKTNVAAKERTVGIDYSARIEEVTKVLDSQKQKEEESDVVDAFDKLL